MQRSRRAAVSSHRGATPPGRGFELTHGAIGATAPDYIANDGDGFPAIGFNATNKATGRIETVPVDPDNPFTICALYKAPSSDGPVLSVGDLGTGRMAMRYVPNSPIFIAQRVSDLANNCEPFLNGAPSDVWYVFHCRFDGTNFFAGISGAEGAGVADVAGGFLPDRLVVGAYTNGGGSIAGFATGKLRALAFFNGDIGLAAGVARVRNIWRHKYPGVA